MGNCTIAECTAALLYWWTGKGSDAFTDAGAVQRPTANNPRTFGNTFPVVRDRVSSFLSSIFDLSAILIFWMLGSPLPSSHLLFLPQQRTTRFHPRETVPRNTVGSSLKISYSTRRFPLPGPNNLIHYFALLYRATEFRCRHTGFEPTISQQ
jgi:hypothetical protein